MTSVEELGDHDNSAKSEVEAALAGTPAPAASDRRVTRSPRAVGTTRTWLGVVAALVVAASACGADTATESVASTSTAPTSTDTSTSTSPSSPWEVVEGDGYTGVITHGSLDQWGPTVSSQQEWTISLVEIAALEEALPDGLRAIDEDAIIPRLPTYTRWYVGVFRGPDRREQIHAMYACRRDESWLERVPMVADGGDCYFSLVYDRESRTVDQIVVNGEA